MHERPTPGVVEPPLGDDALGKGRSVMQGGKLVDRAKVPESRVLSTKPAVATEEAAENATK